MKLNISSVSFVYLWIYHAVNRHAKFIYQIHYCNLLSVCLCADFKVCAGTVLHLTYRQIMAWLIYSTVYNVSDWWFSGNTAKVFIKYFTSYDPNCKFICKVLLSFVRTVLSLDMSSLHDVDPVDIWHPPR